EDEAKRAAASAARAVHERARFQRNQLARLRRRGLAPITVPFRFEADLDLRALEEIARQLERKLTSSPGGRAGPRRRAICAARARRGRGVPPRPPSARSWHGRPSRSP